MTVVVHPCLLGLHRNSCNHGEVKPGGKASAGLGLRLTRRETGRL